MPSVYSDYRLFGGERSPWGSGPSQQSLPACLNGFDGLWINMLTLVARVIITVRFQSHFQHTALNICKLIGCLSSSM